MSDDINAQTEIAVALVWFTLGGLGAATYSYVNQLPQTVSEFLMLYFASLLIVPAFLYVLLTSLSILSLTFVDLLKLVGRVAISAISMLDTPLRVTKSTYINWRQPEKPDSHVITVKKLFEVANLRLEIYGETKDSRVYSYEFTESFLNMIPTNPHDQRMTLEEMSTVSIGRDESIEVQWNDREWGMKKEEIGQWSSEYDGINRLEVTCDVNYDYHVLENKWVPYVENYEIETVEEGVDPDDITEVSKIEL